VSTRSAFAALSAALAADHTHRDNGGQQQQHDYDDSFSFFLHLLYRLNYGSQLMD
jgi:hypothetical protein